MPMPSASSTAAKNAEPGYKSPNLADLARAGFVKRGCWKLDDEGHLALEGEIPRHPGVYLLVATDTVMYVGAATVGLARRVGSYGRTMSRNTRLRPIHHGVKDWLTAGNSLDLYTLEVTKRWEWIGGLPIDPLIGLESGLIEAINPKWNSFGQASRARRAAMLAQTLRNERFKCRGLSQR